MAEKRRQTQTGGRAATSGVIRGGVALSVGDPGSELPDGWSWTALHEVARLETGHTPSRKQPAYWDGDIPWIGIRDATANHGRRITDTSQHVTQAGIDNSSARVLPADTVCLSRTASVGYVVEMGVPMATSQDFVNWVCGPQLNHRYLKYVLLAEHEHLHRFASGTTHQTIYFPEVKAFHVALPALEEQQRIAGLLGALDDKINLNQRTVVHSRELFLAEFASWLTRTEVGNTAPLAELAELTKGVSYRRSDLDEKSPVAMVTLKSVGRGGVYRPDGLKPYAGKYKSAQVLSEGDLAVAQTDVTQAADLIGRVIEVGPTDAYETLVASLDLIVVRPSGPHITREFLLGSLLQPAFRHQCLARANGTTVLHLAKDALPTYQLPVPGAEEIAEFTSTGRPLLEMARRAARESNTLVELRDGLLPKLLSGELRVREAEEAVEGVA